MREAENSRWLVISGNEACDLDSTSCALAYAYFKQQQLGSDVTVIPLCYVNREDMPLRTEVIYWLGQCNVNWEDLIFADDLFGGDFGFRPKACVDLILVDHHIPTGKLAEMGWRIKEVIDHHEITVDEESIGLCEMVRIQRVGSCASLVASQILSNLMGEALPFNVWKILYGAILLDTVGLSRIGESLGRLTDVDLRMGSRIEDMIGDKLFCGTITRHSLFTGLEKAKFNVKGLSSWDLLRRDAKLVTSDQRDGHSFLCSTVSGLDYTFLLQCQDFVDAATRICSVYHCSLLIGITVDFAHCRPSPSNTSDVHAERGDLRKGLFIYTPSNQQELCDQLRDFLCLPTSGLDLCPEDNLIQFPPSVPFVGVIRNPKATRKAVVPLLQTFIRRHHSGCMEEFDTSAASTGADDHGSTTQNTVLRGPNRPFMDRRLASVRLWLQSLTPSERMKVVRHCLLQLQCNDDETAFQAPGILSANILANITDKLSRMMPKDVRAEMASSESHQLKSITVDQEVPKLGDIRTPISKGRRSTVPTASDFTFFHGPCAERQKASLDLSPDDVACALSHVGNKNPAWLETEYLTRLSSRLPGHIISNTSSDAIEGASFRLYRRLSSFPNFHKTKTLSWTMGTSQSVDEAEPAIDETELALLRASYCMEPHSSITREPSIFRELLMDERSRIPQHGSTPDRVPVFSMAYDAQLLFNTTSPDGYSPTPTECVNQDARPVDPAALAL